MQIPKKTVNKIKGYNKNVLKSIILPPFNKFNKKIFINYFKNSFGLTEVLFSSIAKEEGFFTPPPHNLRHPLIFYYAHPAVVYIQKMFRAGIIKKTIDESFEKHFETGVDEMSWDNISKNDSKWQSIKEVNDYRKASYKIIFENLKNYDEDKIKKINVNNPLWSILMGCEHDRIHLETSSVLMREMNIHYFKKSPYLPPSYSIISNGHFYPKVFTSAHLMIPIKGTKDLIIGRNVFSCDSFQSYGWDNEYGHRKIEINDFYASSTLISNGQYMNFVKSGGYLDNSNWCENGLKWRIGNKSKFPKFWIEKNEDFCLRTIFEEIELPLDFPVIVNYYQATAYCKWLGKRHNKPYRLPTEAEYKWMRNGTPLYYKANTNLNLLSEQPVTNSPMHNGLHDLFGNVWQWTSDSFNPLDYFSPHYLYSDFSTPCFDDKHKMIMGGSFMSTGNMCSSFARFHFRPHFLQHVGFRIVYDK